MSRLATPREPVSAPEKADMSPVSSNGWKLRDPDPLFDAYGITHDQLAAHPEFFSADGFHPSDDGYESWAEQMWPAIARVIGAEGQ